MRHGLVILVVVAIIAGCKKDVNTTMAAMQGTWELEKVYSGWGGEIQYDSGNGNTITFSGNSYSISTVTPDTSYTTNGKYNVFVGKPCDGAQEQLLMSLDGSTSYLSVSVTDSTFSMGTTACIADGFNSFYVKLQ